MTGMADSQPKSIGLVWELVATWRQVCTHQTNRVNSWNGFGHRDNTKCWGIIIITLNKPNKPNHTIVSDVSIYYPLYKSVNRV